MNEKEGVVRHKKDKNQYLRRHFIAEEILEANLTETDTI